MNSSQQQQQQQQRVVEERFEKAMMDHLQRYPMELKFPPKISSMEDGRLRTKPEFIYSKLQRLFVPNQQQKPLGEVTQRLDAAIQELEGTGCYESIQFHLKPNQEWNVLLKEKPWYKLYIGGGIKGDPLSEGGDLQTTKLQAETSIGLRNLTGHCDMTNFTYAVDQTSTPNLQFTHDTPLSAYIPSTPLALQIKAMTDTLDHTYTRSCRERISQVQVALKHHETAQECTWTTALRDIMPRRHISLPYTCDASTEILRQAGPSLKHSLKYSNPFLHMELAGPPGDVGFFKCWFAASRDFLLQPHKNDIQFHMALQGGYLHPISFGGLCPNKNQLSDKFFVGGPNQLRGFLPSGIGPRSKTGGSSVPGGDSLGGNVYYASTLAASMPLYQNFRGFTFLNIGNLTSNNNNNNNNILKETRISIGGGISTTLPAPKSPRLEATYAIPLRYGSSDARRRVQAGIGFSIG